MAYTVAPVLSKPVDFRVHIFLEESHAYVSKYTQICLSRGCFIAPLADHLDIVLLGLFGSHRGVAIALVCLGGFGTATNLLQKPRRSAEICYLGSDRQQGKSMRWLCSHAMISKHGPRIRAAIAIGTIDFRVTTPELGMAD